MGGASGRTRVAGETEILDKHVLYEASVQAVETDVDFIERVARRSAQPRPRLLREDFCGSAALSCEWVRRRKGNLAWGVDIHEPTLEWCRRKHLPWLGEAAERLTLVNADVRDLSRPPVDVVAALNFSYFTFKDRSSLREYFRSVHESLNGGGLLVLDVFGGQEAMSELSERRRVKGERAPDGSPVPPFTYVWEQAHFNPIDHHIICHIHFRLGKGVKLRRAFSYDWRLWTLPELRELLSEAGFQRSDVYMDGWDEEAEEGDGIYRRRTYFENDLGWVAYLVAYV